MGENRRFWFAFLRRSNARFDRTASCPGGAKTLRGGFLSRVEPGDEVHVWMCPCASVSLGLGSSQLLPLQAVSPGWDSPSHLTGVGGTSGTGCGELLWAHRAGAGGITRCRNPVKDTPGSRGQGCHHLLPLTQPDLSPRVKPGSEPSAPGPCAVSLRLPGPIGAG